MKNNKFILYPAIDIKNGKCVRLLFGDMEKETIYGTRKGSVHMNQQKEHKTRKWVVVNSEKNDIRNLKQGKNHEPGNKKQETGRALRAS